MNTKISLIAIAVVAVCASVFIAAGEVDIMPKSKNAVADSGSATAAGAAASEGLEVATFAGGCFWCVESTFEKVEGVDRAVSGYAGGTTDNPTYYEVGGGKTGHTETVQIFYDPKVVSYPALLHRFWREIDPTDPDGQFVDRGSVYRPAIFYHDDVQKAQIEASMNDLAASGRFSKPLAVEILPYEKFWKAENNHQDYYKKSPLRYNVYRRGSGRDQYLEKVWGEDLNTEYQPDEENKETSMVEPGSAPASGFDPATFEKPDSAVLKETLSPVQYKVTQKNGTERPYLNAYWNNKASGIYVDVVSGEPLFSSADQFRSGTGWPSFTRPIDNQYIVEELDFKFGMLRTEVRSKYGDGHLGHVFKDGPAPTGLRYCINSAALKFIPATELASSGYDQYQSLF